MLVRSVKTAGAWQEACWPCFVLGKHCGHVCEFQQYMWRSEKGLIERCTERYDMIYRGVHRRGVFRRRSRRLYRSIHGRVYGRCWMDGRADGRPAGRTDGWMHAMEGWMEG